MVAELPKGLAEAIKPVRPATYSDEPSLQVVWIWGWNRVPVRLCLPLLFLRIMGVCTFLHLSHDVEVPHATAA